MPEAKYQTAQVKQNHDGTWAYVIPTTAKYRIEHVLVGKWALSRLDDGKWQTLEWFTSESEARDGLRLLLNPVSYDFDADGNQL